MTHDSPLVIAHRATAGEAPENTLRGLQVALDQSCDGVEIDVQLCADAVPVLLHDSHLERTTNVTGPVAAATLSELAQVDAGQGEPVPTLRQALDLIRGQMLLMIELKVHDRDDVDALCQAVLAEVDRADALLWTWFWSFDSQTVARLAELAPAGRRIAHLCVQPEPQIWQTIAEHRLDGISVHHNGLTEAVVETCQAHDLASFVWTVNEPTDVRRCIGLDPTGIVGDYPKRIQSAMS